MSNNNFNIYRIGTILKKILKDLFFNIFLFKKVNINQLIYSGRASSKKLFEAERFYLKKSSDIENKTSKFFFNNNYYVPDYHIFSINNCINKIGSNFLYDSKFRIITGLAFQEIPFKKEEFYEIRNEEIKFINGSVLSLGLCGLEENYYHCWVEFASRIYAFKQSNIPVDYILLNINKKFIKEILNIFNLDESKIINTSKHKVIKAKNIIYPQLINNWGVTKINSHFLYKKNYLPSWISRIYREIDLKNKNKFNFKKIFISRGNSKKRNLINENNLSKELDLLGFKTINFESLDVEKQICIMKKSELIVGVHGAAMANLSFCKNNTKVLELFPENYQDPSYRIQSSVIGVEYNYYIGKCNSNKKDCNPKDEDFYVEVNKIVNFIKRTWL